MGQWAKGMAMVGGTLVPVGGTLPLQADIINICKAYANHPEERHNMGRMSEETLGKIQPTPPPVAGEEKRSPLGRDLLKVIRTFGHRARSLMRSFSVQCSFHNCLVFHMGGFPDGKRGTGPRWGSRKAYQNPRLPASEPGDGVVCGRGTVGSDDWGSAWRGQRPGMVSPQSSSSGRRQNWSG